MFPRRPGVPVHRTLGGLAAAASHSMNSLLAPHSTITDHLITVLLASSLCFSRIHASLHLFAMHDSLHSKLTVVDKKSATALTAYAEH